MELQKKIYNFILDFWKLVKTYTPPPKQENIPKWDELMAEADDVLKKHKTKTKEDTFFKALMFAWFDYIGKE